MEKIWKVLDNAPAEFLANHPEMPSTVANLLYHRNIHTQEQIDEFLHPDYSKDIHDPFLLQDMEKAVNRILKAIEKQEKIVVHGDYDADGVCASVILVSTLKKLGAEEVSVFLPHRETDGYGLNINTVKNLAEEKTNLIITCDCGISSKEEVESANEKGIDVIITDHHAIPEVTPPAFAIIHPNMPDEPYPDKGLAGGGVAFKLMQGLLARHKETHPCLVDDTTHESFEKWMLDMVAIATIADMVPLTGESRTMTKYGLTVLNKTQRTGLQKLLLEARLMEQDGTKKKELVSHTVGFQIAPRINAAGRMNHANVAYNLLMTESPTEATELAYELNQNNMERQKVTDDLIKRADEQIEKDSPVLFALGKEWPTGVIGLIAGRIKDKYYKPSLIMAENNGEITGSGRSIEGFNLIQAMQEMPEVFAKFGGHPMACGFTLKNKEKLEEFKEKMIAKFQEETSGQELFPILAIDAEVDIDDVNWELYTILDKFQPFGQANEKPKYLSKNLAIHSLEPVGQEGKHLRIMIKSKSGKIRKTIGWHLCNGNAGDKKDWCKMINPGDLIDIVFEMSINEWNGNRELQLTIVDLKKVSN